MYALEVGGRLRTLRSALLVALLVAAAPQLAVAKEDRSEEDAAADAATAAEVADSAAPEVAPVAGPPPFEITGFVDGYSAYGFNGRGADSALRAFDSKTDQFSFAVLEVALEQKPGADRRVGFRADLNFGPTADSVHAFEPGDKDTFKAFEQAYVSYLTRVGGGLQIDVGKFVTPHGAEVIEAKDDWNYTRGLLFTWAIPFYHVGLRASLPVGDKVTVSGLLVNGWNNAVENNDRKTLGLSVVGKPTGSLTLAQNLMAGPELADDNQSQRFLSDTLVSWTVTPTFSLMANYDYGRDENGAAPTATWSGVALYARVQLTEAWALAPRLEWFEDRDGFATGTAQTLEEVTLTSELKLAGGLLSRLEYRRDISDVELFDKSRGRSKSQDTLTLGLVYAFGASL